MLIEQTNNNKNDSRRPSVAKMTKTAATKEVTWSPVEESIMVAGEETAHYYDDIDGSVIWYTHQDLQEIRIASEVLASRLDATESIDDEDETSRGLEILTEQGAWERYQHHRDCINRVLDEQDRQRGIDKLEYPSSAYPLVKRANHLKIPFDHERLGALCRDATACARRQARLRAQRDFEETKADYDDALERISLATTMSTTATKEEEEEEEEEALQRATEHVPPMPAEFSKRNSQTNLIKKLERAHCQRVQVYLTKRQQRIEAAARAALEREQQRLRRAAVIRGEADTNIDQLKRIMTLSQQLTDLVLSTRQS